MWSASASAGAPGSRAVPTWAQVKAIALPPWLNSLDAAANFRTPHYCHSSHTGEYLVGNKWWVWAMARLTALDYFDYFLKVDADVVFYKRMSPTPASTLRK